MRLVDISSASAELGIRKKTLSDMYYRDKRTGARKRFHKINGFIYVDMDEYTRTHGKPLCSVSESTQNKFEILYYKLTEIVSEHNLAKLMSNYINAKSHAIEMRMRDYFFGGKEKTKLELVLAMEKVANELGVHNA